MGQLSKRLLYCLAITAAVVAVAVTQTNAITAVVPAAKDNTLFQDPSGALSSGAGQYLFAGNNSSANIRRALLRFDIAAYLPSGASIDSVALVLNVSSAPNDTPQPVALHIVLEDWGEGTSVSSGGSGAPSTPGDATWIHTFYPDQWWTTAGGSFRATASATTVVGASGAHVWSSAAMRADVQAWLSHDIPNLGWILVGAENTTSTVRRFDSRENAVESNRPYLFISYTAPVAARETTWGAIKVLYRDERVDRTATHSGRKP